MSDRISLASLYELLDRSFDYLLVVDEEQKVHHVNRAFGELMDCEGMGPGGCSSLADIVKPEVLPRFQEAMDRVAAGERAVVVYWKVKEDRAPIIFKVGYVDRPAGALYMFRSSLATDVADLALKSDWEKIERAKEDSIFQRFLKRARGSAKGVRVDGVRDMLIHFGKCCQPVPGDRIIGFITRGRGIVVHRADCKNLLAMTEDPNRYIEVEWDVTKDHQFLASLRVLGENRKGLLADISQAIANADTNIVNAEMKAEDSVASGTFIIEVRNLSQLMKVMHKIRKVRGVISVSRMEGGAGEGEVAGP